MASSEITDETPILEELADAGYEYESIDQLRTSGTRYRKAVSVLVKWLQEEIDEKTKTALVRALSVPWAKPAASIPMIREFRKVPQAVDPNGLGLRWTIGNALAVLNDESILKDLIAIAQDSSFGRSREMVVLGLARFGNEPAVVTSLLRLSKDPDVDGHAVSALRMLRAPEAREVFERALTDTRAWVRKEAEKGLGAI